MKSTVWRLIYNICGVVILLAGIGYTVAFFITKDVEIGLLAIIFLLVREKHVWLIDKGA